MQLCDQFRALVDRSIAQSPSLDASAIEARYGKQFADVQPGQRYTVLSKAIGEALKSPNQTGLTFQQFKNVRKALKFQSIWGLAVDPYVDLAHVIQDSARYDFVRPFSEEAAWLNAIMAARSYTAIQGALPDIDLRAAAVTDAAKRLITEGYRVQVKDDRLQLDDREFDRLCSDIEADVRLIGGGVVLIQIFNFLRASKQHEFERYIPGRTFDRKPRLPSLPVGYLLNLGVKHLNSAPMRDDRAMARIWTRIAERARDLCALYDIEPYNYIENIVLAPRGVPAYVSSIALFDHIFPLRQWRPSETIALIKGFLDFVDSKKMQDLLGWTLDDACRVVQIAFDLSGGLDMSAISDDQIVGGGIDAMRWQRMRPHFVHDFGAANRDYLKPVDADKSDFGFKPFVEIHKKRLLVISPSLSALGFFEAITRALRGAGYPRLDQDMGSAVERVTAAAFSTHGINITIQGSTYSMLDPLTGGKQTGECDVVVETPECIVFIETKKKPHRRASATGDALANLIDLSGSLFDAQAQLAQHERILLRHQYIQFDDGKRLNHGGRDIERMAITLLDYGSPQDKFFLRQLFGALAGVSFGAEGIDATNAEKLSELNASVALLVKEIETLVQLGKTRDELFFNCWFLARLKSLKHFTYRTLDFYRDFGLARRGKLI
jgi:hypothetical protein